MNRAQLVLVGHSILMIAVLLVAVPTLTSLLGGPLGYVVSIALYWVGFCVPVVLRIPAAQRRLLVSPRLARKNLWVPLLVVTQVAAIIFGGLVPHLSELTPPAIALGIGMALVNGTLEEAAWRGGYLTAFADRPVRGFWLGWAFFVAWHVPLALSQGIVFDGGALTLIGGAAGLGLLWSAITWRTGSVFWPALGHVLTNVAVFPVLVQANHFV